MKRINLFILLSFFSFGIFGQIDLKKITPPNPNVASLMKDALTPVTKYAGLPNVNIPLYAISEDNIQIPLSLSYHTGGIQVSEESGVVGLGWNINMGGVITRNINGMDDFKSGTKAYLFHSEQHPDPLIVGSYYNPDSQRFLQADSNCNFPVNGVLTHFSFPEIGLQQNDFMPDTFNFNFNGYSGTFVLKRDGTVVLTEKKGIKIIPDYSQGNLLVKFTILTEDGTEYFFNQREISQRVEENDTQYISTWYLSKITTINDKEINFIYEDKGNSYPLKTFIQHYQVATDNCEACGATKYVNYFGPQNQIEDIYIKEIQFTNGKVIFNYSASGERLDTKTFFLNNLQIFNLSKLIKKYDFNYSYFGASWHDNPTPISPYPRTENGDFAGNIQINSENPSINLRLKLDSIVEDDLKTHSFEYFDSQNTALIPNKTTMSQDYWGFYNGIINNTSFIPYYRNFDNTNYDVPIKAKRYPVETKTKLFSLKKIIYPTKGFTQFDYELNTYSDVLPTILGVPPTTIAKRESINTLGGGVVASKTIHPNLSSGLNSELKLDFNLAIYGSNVQNWNNHPFNFALDMYVTFRRKADNHILWWQTLPTEQASFQFSQTGQAFYSIELTYSTNPVNNFYLDPNYDEYLIEVYFNDHNSLYFGQAELIATWEEVEQSETESFSVGGGLRVKSITDYDSNGEELRKRNFNYHYKAMIDGVEVEKSYGKIKTLPNFDVNKSTIYTWIQIGTAPELIYQLNALPTILANATSHNSFSKDLGSYVGYDQVEVVTIDKSGNDNGKTISKFYNSQDLFGSNTYIEHIDDYYKYEPIRIPHNGLLYKEEIYKRSNSNQYIMVKKVDKGFEINGFDANVFGLPELYQNTDYTMSAIKELKKVNIPELTFLCSNLLFQFHPYYSNLIEQSFQKETVYDSNGQNPVVTNQKFFYDNDEHLQLTRTETTDSKGNLIKTKTDYPQDKSNLINLSPEASTSIDKLITLHRIAMPIQTETTVTNANNVELSKSSQRTNYKDWSLNIPGTGNIILPEFVQTAKGNNPLENRLTYHNYDNKGNPLEVSKADGTHTYYIWGYEQSLPIAKLENFTASDAQVTQGLIDAAVLASNADIDQTTEATLRTALNNLKNDPVLSKAQITTYTYDPLIGVTSITDPRGYTIYYEYDEFNRLKQVKDAQGKILSKNEYHFKD